MLGNNMTNILSDESTDEYRNGFISRELIVDHLKVPDSKVYVCGPPKMMEKVLEHLDELEVAKEAIVKEEF